MEPLARTPVAVASHHFTITDPVAKTISLLIHVGVVIVIVLCAFIAAFRVGGLLSRDSDGCCCGYRSPLFVAALGSGIALRIP
jgi:hypothetical protein